MNDVIVPVRQAMAKKHSEFNGSFLPDCQNNSIPIELLTLICMLIDVVGRKNNSVSQAALTSCHHTMYHFEIITRMQRKEVKGIMLKVEKHPFQ